MVYMEKNAVVNMEKMKKHKNLNISRTIELFSLNKKLFFFNYLRASISSKMRNSRSQALATTYHNLINFIARLLPQFFFFFFQWHSRFKLWPFFIIFQVCCTYCFCKFCNTFFWSVQHLHSVQKKKYLSSYAHCPFLCIIIWYPNNW